MSRPDPPFGIVSIASLDLRVAPDHRSELASQLLLGEAVRRLGTRGGGAWWRVEGLADGYRGWVRSWGLAPATAAGLMAWVGAASGRVRSLVVAARARPGGGATVGPLYWNSRVGLGERSGGWRRVVLPTGRRAWVEARAVASGSAEPPRLVDRLATLSGIPYLWGGRTPTGFDCSGLTQQVLAEQGWRLPRDAHEQWAACRRVPSPGQARPGDLIFFASGKGPVGHVGLWLGGGLYAHSRGAVGRASLSPDNRLYDKELAGQFQSLGRPVLRATSGVPGPGEPWGRLTGFRRPFYPADRAFARALRPKEA